VKIRTATCALLFCMACLSFGLGQNKKHDRAFMINAFTMKLSADKVTFTAGEPVTVKVTMTNTTKETLYMPNTQWEWSVLREDGKPVADTPEGLKIKAARGASTTMNVSIPLAAGASYPVEGNLAELYVMTEPGAYLVSVQQKVRDESGSDYIRSNTIRITIQ
jgi:hypothetical protein